MLLVSPIRCGCHMASPGHNEFKYQSWDTEISWDLPTEKDEFSDTVLWNKPLWWQLLVSQVWLLITKLTLVWSELGSWCHKILYCHGSVNLHLHLHGTTVPENLNQQTWCESQDLQTSVNRSAMVQWTMTTDSTHGHVTSPGWVDLDMNSQTTSTYPEHPGQASEKGEIILTGHVPP